MSRAVPQIALAAACLCCAGGDAAAQPAQPTTGQLIAARQAGMHMAATLYYRGIKPAAANGSDPKDQVHEAEGIALWARALPGLFPAGSAREDSGARPEIWSDRAGFVQKAEALRAAAARLLELARAGDRAGFAAQAPAVEAACTACHSAYRAD